MELQALDGSRSEPPEADGGGDDGEPSPETIDNVYQTEANVVESESLERRIQHTVHV